MLRRAPPLLRTYISTRVPGPLSSHPTLLRLPASPAPRAFHLRPDVCTNCWLAGHQRKDCTETLCAVCGVEGHQPRDCPSPAAARLKALRSVAAASLLTFYLSPFIFIFGVQ
ncbi:hypothetical protein C8R44DRAFT_879670 [Mycena epipterygia]|nr:hypothetical protein C8R44DRAFT_879670 [Mycena epipterygia]